MEEIEAASEQAPAPEQAPGQTLMEKDLTPEQALLNTPPKWVSQLEQSVAKRQPDEASFDETPPTPQRGADKRFRDEGVTSIEGLATPPKSAKRSVFGGPEGEPDAKPVRQDELLVPEPGELERGLADHAACEKDGAREDDTATSEQAPVRHLFRRHRASSGGSSGCSGDPESDERRRLRQHEKEKMDEFLHKLRKAKRKKEKKEAKRQARREERRRRRRERKQAAKWDLRKLFKQGQQRLCPPVADATRAFYESLFQENPDSRMAIKYCVEHGIFPLEQHKRVLDKYLALKARGALEPLRTIKAVPVISPKMRPRARAFRLLI